MTVLAQPEMPSEVARVFAGIPEAARDTLLEMRTLLFEVAGETDRVGRLTECLKWGEPAYLTEESRSGSTIRLAWKPSRPDKCGAYFICHSGLVDEFRNRFPDELDFDGNRAILVGAGQPVPKVPVSECFALALTWHDRRKTGRRRVR